MFVFPDVDFLDDTDIETLLAAGPNFDEEHSNQSQYSDMQLDLDAMSIGSFDNVFSDLTVNTNTLHNVSSFAVILSPTSLSNHLNSSGLSLDTYNDMFLNSLPLSPSQSVSTKSISVSTSPERKISIGRLNGRSKMIATKKSQSQNGPPPFNINGSKASSSSGRVSPKLSEGRDDAEIFGTTEAGQWAGAGKYAVPIRTGRWAPDEHKKFLQGIAQHGRNWDKVAQTVLTRTTVQVRSHAQKYFKKLAHRERYGVNQGRNSGGSSGRYVAPNNYNYDDLNIDSMSDAMIMEAAALDIHCL